MEIFNKHKKSSYKEIKKKLSLKRLTIISIFFIGLIVFGFGSIVYGAYLNKTGQTVIIKNFITRLSEFDFSFIPKHIKSNAAEVENLTIDINFKNWEKIRYYREKGLIHGNLNNLPPEEVNAKIRFNNKTYKAKISITGQTTEHFKHPYKWSLLIKLKNGKTIKGVNKFALLYPRSRGYLTDWIAYKLLKSQDLIGLKTDFVNLEINGKSNGLYYFEERFGKSLLVNNIRKNGIIFKRDGNLKVYELNKEVLKSKELSKQLIYLKKILHSFYTNKISVEKVFDIKKFATLFVVSDIMNQKHALFRGNSRLYFNPVTNLIEPIGREWGYLRRSTNTPLSLSIEKPDPKVNFHENLHKDSILNKFINSNQFIEEYIKQANILSNKNYLDSILEYNDKELYLLLKKIHKQNPFYTFPLKELYKNQEIIRNKLNPVTPSINVSFNQINKDSLILNFENRIDLPIEIHYIKYNKTIINHNEQLIIKPKYKSSYNANQMISLKLAKEINKSDFSPDSLDVYYSILGLKNIKKVIVFSKLMEKNDYLELTPTKQPANIEDFEFLTINYRDKIIEFSHQNCIINNDLIIPKGYNVMAKPGCKINLTNSAKIISYSPLLFFGNKEKPITITSSDSTGQGIIVFNCKRISELNYVNFNSLSNINTENWNLNGVITFYESTVNLNNCNFYDNKKGKSYLNIIRSDLNIFDSTFKNTFANALDIDFCTGKIENVKFQSIKKNAISAVGSKIIIKDVEIQNSKGRGILGEKGTHLICDNIKINQSNFAIISKDNSTIDIDEINISSSNLAFSALQENKGYGPGIINAKKVITKNVKKEFLIEVGSSLTINGNKINNKAKKVEGKLKNYEGKNTSEY